MPNACFEKIQSSTEKEQGALLFFPGVTHPATAESAEQPCLVFVSRSVAGTGVFFSIEAILKPLA